MLLQGRHQSWVVDAIASNHKALVSSAGLESYLRQVLYLPKQQVDKRTRRIVLQQIFSRNPPFLFCLYNKLLKIFSPNHGCILSKEPLAFAAWFLPNDVVAKPHFSSAIICKFQQLQIDGFWWHRRFVNDSNNLIQHFVNHWGTINVFTGSYFANSTWRFRIYRIGSHIKW